MAKAFYRQTKAQKRVTIAKDVLKWLDTKKVRASPGVYLDVYDGKELVTEGDTVNGYKCEACALGAIFACTVERAKAARSGGFNVSSGHMRSRLGPYFERDQLAAIENAFEQTSVIPTEASTGTWSPQYEGADFSADSSPTRRMRAIMKNIIRNNGTFIP